MPRSAPTPAERAIAAAIYAPIGLGAHLVDDLPEALDKARQQIVFARFIGKMAVDQGVKELRHRLAPDSTASDADMAAGDDRHDADVTPQVPTPDPLTAPSPDELALPDYDQLPASHVVNKLAGLTSVELDAIEAYEMTHRHRRTVLGKIAQLKAA